MVGKARADDEARAQLPLTPVVLHVLLSLADRPRHGLGIMHEVEERTDGRVRLGPGTLYGSIKRMLGSGLIDETDERPDRDDDPRRRYYAISELGRRVLELETERLAELLGMARDKRVYRGAGGR